MAFESWNNAIYMNYNKSDDGNLLPQRLQNEKIIVLPQGCAMLSQISYSKNRLIIDGYSEVFDSEEIGENNFKVGYDTSCLVWFHPSKIGSSILVKEFYGIGVQYINMDRIMYGFDKFGKPITPFDAIKEAIQEYLTIVKNDYDNRIKPEFEEMKSDYKTNVKDDYTVNVRQDYETNVKDAYKTDVVNPWTNDLKPELLRAIENYHNSTNPTWITNANWTKAITVDNTNTFQLELSSFNPVGDQVSKFAYQSAGQEGAIELIEGEHWRRTGATINLLKGLVFMRGDKVFINVYRGMAVTPIAGTNGGDLQNKSVSESKLSQDVQDKLNTVYYENTMNFVATVNNTTKFTIADSTFNPVTDKLKIYQDNMLIRKDDNYTLNGMVVTLAEALNIGDKIYYEIGKNAVSNITNYMADGGLIRDGSISGAKLTKDIRDELDKALSISSELSEKASKTDVELLERDKSDKSTVKSISDDIQLFKQGVITNNLQVNKDISNLTMKDTTLQNSLKTLDKSKAGSESVTSANGYLLIPDTLQLTTGYLNKVRLNNNGMVSINVNIASRDGGNSIIDGTKIATLYPGFKPSSTIIIPVIVGRDNGHYSGGGYAVINKNGDITVTSFESKPFKNVYLTNINFETQRFENLYVNKNIATFGDSVTWYDSRPYYDNHTEYGRVCVGYQSYLLQDTGMNLFNEGVSGATSLNMVSTIKSYSNFSQMDFVSLTIGTNDHRLGTPLGNIMAKGSNFNETTFYGALQKSIEHIKITKPTIKIFMMTPTKCFYDVNNSVTNPNIGNNGNVLNVKFINAIKEIATLYNIPLLNWYDDIDITWGNRHEYFGDKESIGYWIHPKMNLYGLMGRSYSKFILDNM